MLRLLRGGRDFSFAGVPYWTRSLVRLAGTWRDRDRVLAGFETDAMRRHGSELAEAGVQQLFTGDEFELAGHALHAELARGGVRSVNISHGVGVYGPVVRYDHFRFYNRQQARFYAARGVFETSDVRNHLAGDWKAADAVPTRYDPVLVYLMGNWQQKGPSHERDFERTLLGRAQQASLAAGIPFLVKSHPNTGWLQRRRLGNRYGIRFVRDLEIVEGRQPIFLNLLSSAFYDFAPLGPTLFLSDVLLRPEDLFGEGVHCVAIDALESELARFREPRHWLDRHHADAALLRREGHAEPPGSDILGNQGRTTSS